MSAHVGYWKTTTFVAALAVHEFAVLMWLARAVRGPEVHVTIAPEDISCPCCRAPM
jgi:hypothetical protein